MEGMTFERVRAFLDRTYAARKWLLSLDVLAAAPPIVSALQEHGASSCFCIGGSRGTGPLPDPAYAMGAVDLGIVAGDIMSGIRLSLAALADLSPEIVAQVDAFDPTGEARVLGTIFDDGRDVAQRKKFGARPGAWQLLEDKTVIDDLWDRAGVARAPARVVPASEIELVAAGAAVDRGEGTVWSGDSSEGFNGGATYVRWVRSSAEAQEAAAFFARHCQRVRVMSFLEGIPCSIHGFVFADYVVALRPCEMVVLRKPGGSRFHYARAASFWDPSPGDRDEMRTAARRVGEHLRTSLGYRGAFTIDGVMSRDGFLPTELNPRLGAALMVVTRGVPLSMLLLNAAIVEGVEVDFDPRELETELLAHMDAHRAGGGTAIVAQAPPETRSASLSWTRDRFEVSEGDDADAKAHFGSSPAGGYVMVDLVPERTAVGPSVAPRIAAALACLDAHWQLGLGALVPAKDVRRQATG